ncbi:hypothetical protein LIER_36833 [Lithospermum erythrorhizon]|uniref:Uncharacterized protein n=1 Tax=Lithospermum erythrorhizon TaxID=34254 RepID=A0AAV3PF77_LITER
MCPFFPRPLGSVVPRGLLSRLIESLLGVILMAHPRGLVRYFPGLVRLLWLGPEEVLRPRSKSIAATSMPKSVQVLTQQSMIMNDTVYALPLNEVYGWVFIEDTQRLEAPR